MNALLTEGLIKPHPFLKNCTADFLNHLEEFASEVNFKKGDTILRQGNYADRFYLICEGKISLEASYNGYPATVIQILGPGEVLGWSWLYPPFVWHFTARALEPCQTVALNAPALLVRAEADPAFGYQLMKRIGAQVIQRLQATRKRLLHEIKERDVGSGRCVVA